MNSSGMEWDQAELCGELANKTLLTEQASNAWLLGFNDVSRNGRLLYIELGYLSPTRLLVLRCCFSHTIAPLYMSAFLEGTLVFWDL